MLMPLSKVPTANGQAPAAKTVAGQQRRALRKLIRDLVAFTGTAINDLAATPRKAPQRKRQRLLYRRADSLTNADLDALVGAIGIDRWWAAAERATHAADRGGVNHRGAARKWAAPLSFSKEGNIQKG